MPKTTSKEYSNKDFTDYFLLFINTGREQEFFSAFKNLVDSAKNIQEVYPELFEKENILTKQEDELNYQDLNFYDIIQEKYINTPISFKAIIRGESVKPYLYPIKVRLTCNISKGDSCMSCGLFLTGGKIEINLDTMNPLEFIDINDKQKISLIKNKIGILQCGQFKIETLEQKYIQELFLSPYIEEISSTVNPELDDKKEQRFIIRHAFSEGCDLIPNKTYKFYAIPTSLPKNQTLIFYVKKYKEEESRLDKFNLTEKDIQDLKIFQPKDDKYESIQEKLDEIYNDLSNNLSPIIRHRNDLMLCCDLAFHSVLNFWLGGSFEKGWVEGLIVGDTSTGKTQIASKLIRHYRVGLIQGAENSTIAGLIGGMSKFESINIMTWGLLPVNDCRLIVLDEMSGIPKELFSELTRIRSEGIAERTIVGGTSSTKARVRLIWLSNPRKRSMSLYDSGCDMIKELVTQDEDISRFDFIYTVSGDELTSDQINILRTFDGEQIKHRHTSELCNKLILWAWSRKSNNIIFDENVEVAILHYSKLMSETYTPHFPLVLTSTIRLKIARLSIALAARLFSFKDNNILVTVNHVTYIYNFLNKVYNKNSFGYGEYSKYFKTSEKQTKDSRTDILKDLNLYCYNEKKNFILNMLTNPRITAIEIRDFLGCNKDRADDFRTKLVANGFLIKKAGFYVKSDIFRKFLKTELKDIEKKEEDNDK